VPWAFGGLGTVRSFRGRRERSKPEPFTHRRVRHPREFQWCFRWIPVPRGRVCHPPDRGAVIGIHEGRKKEGSAKNPPKGKVVRGVFFPALTGWAIFCHASGVGPGMHRLRKHDVVVRLPGRPDESSAKNPTKGKFVRGVLFMSRLKPLPTKLA
jgi:hypothetical protein